jgi:photosystem II stability/assembly factor-like uncharacterized protein
LTAWVVNSDGLILHTADGGGNWTRQEHLADSYLRCVSFAGTDIGWVGTLSGPNRLYATKNGGADWECRRVVTGRHRGESAAYALSIN